MTLLGIPPPIDGDDDDVAWALQTAAVQWKRGAYADAIVWLRRAVDAAIQVGAGPRATELNGVATALTEQMLQAAATPQGAPPAQADDVDSLLGNVPGPAPGRASIDIEFDDEAVTEAGQAAPANPFLQPDSVPPRENPFQPPAPPWHTEPAPPPPPRPSADSLTTVMEDPLSESTMQVHSAELTSDVPSQEHVTEPPLPPFDHVDSPTEAAPPGSELPPPRVVTSAPPRMATPPPRMATPPPPRMASPPPPPSTAIRTPPPPRAATPPPPPEHELDTQTEVVPPPSEMGLTDAAPPLDEEVKIGNIVLGEVRGLEDLPPEAQQAFAAQAQLETLDIDEEVGHFAVALVIEGWVSIMPTIADTACATASPGDVVFTTGTLSEGVELRVVAGESDSKVAVWDAEALEAATADCPWVADELRLVADRFQALAGATMGLLGERLDESLREQVTSRCEVKTFLPGEEFVTQGAAVPGMHIVGAGRVELVSGEGDDAEVLEELGPGDFLFASEVLSAGSAHASARAGDGGALILFAPRMAAHELLVSVPPLLEIFAS